MTGFNSKRDAAADKLKPALVWPENKTFSHWSKCDCGVAQEPSACCHACFKASGAMLMTRIILCPSCGNKRCPKASNHRLECTDSNESGQAGSVYTNPTAAQPAQKPVAWAVQGCSKMWRGEFAEIDAKAEAKRIGGTCVAYALYTAPPQREWVGLTNEEWLLLGCKSVEEVRIGLAIQAKLKEKNT
jgi:hypothetical protein